VTADSDLIDRFRGVLVGTAVGDALGAPVEGHPYVPGDYAQWLTGDEANLEEWLAMFNDGTPWDYETDDVPGVGLGVLIKVLPRVSRIGFPGLWRGARRR
jgi:hypothetical protein